MNPVRRSRRTHVPRRDPCTTVVLARAGAEVASWPLARSGRVDLAVVDELARLQLAARRLGCSIRLRDACVDLRELLAISGLIDLLPGAADSEVGGQAERGEEVGVEEVVQPDDPVA